MLVTHLRAKVEISRQPHLKERPVLVVDRDPSRARPLVVDRSPAARRARNGMILEQALSHHGNAVVLDADEPHYRRVFGRMLAALQGISDRVEGDELGTAYVGLDGLEELFRGEAGGRLRAPERGPGIPRPPRRRGERQVPPPTSLP